MSSLHIFCETGAFGDTVLNLCRANIAMHKLGHEDVIVHSSKTFKYNDNREAPTNPDILEIYKKTNFVKEVVFDVDYENRSSLEFSKKYNTPILQPMFFKDKHDVRDWVDLKEFLPKDIEGEKLALFQPISLKMKPQSHLDDYTPVWSRCLKTLLRKKYKIVMVGGKDDPIDLCVPKDLMKDIDNKIGKWSILEAIAFTLYKADIAVACDSWAALWSVASRKKTAIAWGYRMENNIDFWVTGFLGNQDCYKYGWSSQKDYTDALLANYLGA